MLDGEEEGAVGFEDDGFGLFEYGRGSHHRHRRGGCGFSSFLIQFDEGLVKHLGDVQVVIGVPGGHGIKICAAAWFVEGGGHA